MASATYQSTTPFSISSPNKDSAYISQPVDFARVPRGVSPPESAVASTTGGTFSSVGCSEYNSSVSDAFDTNSVASARGIDLVELLNSRLPTAFDTLPLDKGLAKQAQTSGELNAKQHELAELRALAQQRLKIARANFADGMRAAKEVRRDLEWTHKKVEALKSTASQRHPDAYMRAERMYPTPIDC